VEGEEVCVCVFIRNGNRHALTKTRRSRMRRRSKRRRTDLRRVLHTYTLRYRYATHARRLVVWGVWKGDVSICISRVFLAFFFSAGPVNGLLAAQQCEALRFYSVRNCHWVSREFALKEAGRKSVVGRRRRRKEHLQH
jgi:hypothetical protein